jgi:3D (Asp-Asp-Asp) domain-containing protein
MPSFALCHALWQKGCGTLHGLLNSDRAAKPVHTSVLTLLLGATMGVAISSQVNASPKKEIESKHPVLMRRVTLSADGDASEILTGAQTVEEFLTQQHVPLTENDRCSISLKAPLKDGMTVVITRVRVETTVERIPLPFSTRRAYLTEVEVGDNFIKQEGKDGAKVVTYHDYFRDGKRTERVYVSTKIIPPTAQIEVRGVRDMTLASRHLFAGRRIISMHASAYGPGGSGGWGARTATGRRVGVGVVAVDPRFIPLGTRLYVEGYGFAVAGDTGSAIKGDRIDLGMDSDGAASQFGRRTVHVIILD